MLRDNDYLQQRITYIKKNLKKGYTTESLRWALISQGYSRSEVERAIRMANEQLADEVPSLKEKPLIKVESTPSEMPLSIEPEESFFSRLKRKIFG